MMIPDNCSVLLTEASLGFPDTKVEVVIENGACINMIALNVEEAGVLHTLPLLTKEGLLEWVNTDDGIVRCLEVL